LGTLDEAFFAVFPEMSEAAIGVLRTGRLAAFALTLSILAQ